MEGTGSSNGRERRAARMLDFDLNKEPSPEPEEPAAPQEQLPLDEAPEVPNPGLQLPASARVRVIHDLEADPKVDVVFDLSNVERNVVDMVLTNSSKFAREGKKLEARGAKIHEDGGVSLSLGVKKNSTDQSGTGAKQEPAGAGRKRAKSRTTQDHNGDPEDGESSSTEEAFGPPKIRWKSRYEKGDAHIQRSWNREQQNP